LAGTGVTALHASYRKPRTENRNQTNVLKETFMPMHNQEHIIHWTESAPADITCDIPGAEPQISLRHTALKCSTDAHHYFKAPTSTRLPICQLTLRISRTQTPAISRQQSWSHTCSPYNAHSNIFAPSNNDMYMLDDHWRHIDIPDPDREFL
jgi:hypothetical protein